MGSLDSPTLRLSTSVQRKDGCAFLLGALRLQAVAADGGFEPEIVKMMTEEYDFFADEADDLLQAH